MRRCTRGMDAKDGRPARETSEVQGGAKSVDGIQRGKGVSDECEPALGKPNQNRRLAQTTQR